MYVWELSSSHSALNRTHLDKLLLNPSSVTKCHNKIGLFALEKREKRFTTYGRVYVISDLNADETYVVFIRVKILIL